MVQMVMNFLYIGNFADLDTDETNWSSYPSSPALPDSAPAKEGDFTLGQE